MMAAALALALALLIGEADSSATVVGVVVDAVGGQGLGRHSEQLMVSTHAIRHPPLPPLPVSIHCSDCLCLQGVTAYGNPDFDQPRAQQLVRELGIKSIGVQAVVTGVSTQAFTRGPATA